MVPLHVRWRLFTYRLRCLTRSGRANVRRIDARVYWPRIWIDVNQDVVSFLASTMPHIAFSAAWRYPSEWSHTDEAPYKWFQRAIAGVVPLDTPLNSMNTKMVPM